MDDQARAEARARLNALLAKLEAASTHPPMIAIRHPGGSIEVEDGNFVACSDYAQRLVEHIGAGGVISLPSTRDEYGHPVWDIVPTPPSLLLECLRGLAWLLGLTGQELAFVQRLAERPTDGIGIAAFADWLEEQGRDGEAARMRRAAEGPDEGRFS